MAQGNVFEEEEQALERVVVFWPSILPGPGNHDKNI